MPGDKPEPHRGPTSILLPPNQPRVACFSWFAKSGNAASHKGWVRSSRSGERMCMGWAGTRRRTRLQNKALLVAALAGGARHESSAGGMLKNLADTLAGSGRALQVLVRADLLGNSLSLRGCVSFIDAVSWARMTLTSEEDTGFWLVALKASMVLGSSRRSALQPTRMMGRPEQKCTTSEIHC